jgi:hypothetical protein
MLLCRFSLAFHDRNSVSGKLSVGNNKWLLYVLVLTRCILCKCQMLDTKFPVGSLNEAIYLCHIYRVNNKKTGLPRASDPLKGFSTLQTPVYLTA